MKAGRLVGISAEERDNTLIKATLFSVDPEVWHPDDADEARRDYSRTRRPLNKHYEVSQTIMLRGIKKAKLKGRRG